MSSHFTGREPVESGHLPGGAVAGQQSLYGQVYFVPESAFGQLPAAGLTTMVLRGRQVPGTVLGPGTGRNGSLCAAQFVVSTDPPERFDVDLSMREPLELQVWPDGSFTVEVEFAGPDARTAPEAGQDLAATERVQR